MVVAVDEQTTPEQSAQVTVELPDPSPWPGTRKVWFGDATGTFDVWLDGTVIQLATESDPTAPLTASQAHELAGNLLAAAEIAERSGGAR